MGVFLKIYYINAFFTLFHLTKIYGILLELIENDLGCLLRYMKKDGKIGNHTISNFFLFHNLI